MHPTVGVRIVFVTHDFPHSPYGEAEQIGGPLNSPMSHVNTGITDERPTLVYSRLEEVGGRYQERRGLTFSIHALEITRGRHEIQWPL